MNNNYNIYDISKETLTFISFFDNEMIKKIPNWLIEELCNQAADSKIDFYIDPNKKLEDQEISDESKDLISLIYYRYIAESDEKKQILKNWNTNEIKSQKPIQDNK